MKNKFGLIGLMSLIGFAGFITGERFYFFFFAFVIFFEYFFKQPDEMFVDNLRKASSNAFWSGMASTVFFTLYYAFLKNSANSLEKGIAIGFGISIIVFCLNTAYSEFKEGRVAKK